LAEYWRLAGRQTYRDVSISTKHVWIVLMVIRERRSTALDIKHCRPTSVLR